MSSSFEFCVMINQLESAGMREAERSRKGERSSFNAREASPRPGRNVLLSAGEDLALMHARVFETRVALTSGARFLHREQKRAQQRGATSAERFSDASRSPNTLLPVSMECL